MARAVYHPGELEPQNSKVALEPPFPEEKPEAPPDLNADDVAIFSGPSPAEIQAAAEKRLSDAETERARIINAASTEGESYIADSKRQAEERVAAAQAEAEGIIAAAQAEAEKIRAEAENAAQTISGGAEAKCEEARRAAHAGGVEEGRKEGYEKGFAEVQRLVARTQVILERLQDKRAEVLAEAEQEVIDLAILVARKVVKTISESQRGIIIENIKEALAKVKTKGKIIVKVNLGDLELVGAQIDEFIKLVEGGGNIQIMEDSSVDAGGCVIETDFGEVDARIASQFAELEARILELSPMKSKAAR